MARLTAYELYRSGRVSTIEVSRVNAEAGRDLGSGASRFTNRAADHEGGANAGAPCRTASLPT